MNPPVTSPVVKVHYECLSDIKHLFHLPSPLVKIPAQCLTVRHKAEAEHISKDEVGKVFSIKAVGWKKSTPIVKFKSVNEDRVPSESCSGHSPTGLAKEQETRPSVEMMEKKDGGEFDRLDSPHFIVPLHQKSCTPEESPSIDQIQQQVVHADASLDVPESLSTRNSLVSDADETLDHDSEEQKAVKESKGTKCAFPDPASISAVQPAQIVSSLISEIDRTTLVIGRVQEVYVVHYESPADFYVTPSLEKLKEFQK